MAQEFGKTVFIAIMAKLISKRKILIIDFDAIGNHMHAIFGVKAISKQMREELKKKEYIEDFKLKERNLSKLAVKIDRNVDLISKTSDIFDDSYKIRKDKIKEMLEEMQSKYDLIMIDTSSDTKYKTLTKLLAELSSQIICVIQGNLIYIRNTIRMLKEYGENTKKLKLVYNKKDKYTLATSIMRLIFLKYQMVGCLHYERKYNKIVNHNMKKRELNEQIKKEYREIIRNCKW